MNGEEVLQQIKEWQQTDEHQKIIDAIEALPPEIRDCELTCLLARAYINVSDQGDPERGDASLEKAASLLESVREDGKNDAVQKYFQLHRPVRSQIHIGTLGQVSPTYSEGAGKETPSYV